MRIEIPQKVDNIIEALTEAGFEAYAVGGCVRDVILGRIPNDWDITTSAKPLEIKKCFSRTIDTGIKHGTVTVMMGKAGFEVTTYRIDGEYEDARHPKEVTFCTDLHEDLLRRDFTINAMAYNHKDGLVDIFGGQQDMDRKLIRCVGEATERFTEDALRMMRAVRFSAQLGYTIEEKTGEAIRQLAPNLKKISAERVREELTKLLESPNPSFIEKAHEYGITKIVLPEWDEKVEDGKALRIMKALEASDPDKLIRYTILFDGDAEEAMVVLRRLKFDNDTITKVRKLSASLYKPISANEVSIRKTASLLGRELFLTLLKIQAAIADATKGKQALFSEEEIKKTDMLFRMIAKRGDCLALKELAVTGGDLIECGMKPGKEVGEVLQKLLEIVLEHPEQNTKEFLLTQI
ncbi:MAG: CCA tRNA nucleotidyltransferase [Lachnospiraceae bacterium]|nr:CCA tRNA nucleotidyltransferase [Lachnospiraceae bacterium]